MHAHGEHTVSRPTDDDVTVPTDELGLHGHLTVPAGATRAVVFAHGSGSSRLSPRNRFVADRLNAASVATLLLDLLTPEEALNVANAFDIEMLAERLSNATRWLYRRPETAGLPLGAFGASTGAAAALSAAAAPDSLIGAVVSRGGRVDLAGDVERVVAPTLLIVGSCDRQVLAINRETARRLRCPHRIAVVEGASHLFEESGALEAVAQLAADWFEANLRHEPRREPPREP
jgi:putative phosphoribosyl transferase